MDPEKRQEKIERYGAAYEQLVEALAQFPREMWQYRPAPDDWTIHEIVIHITDSEANSYVRARRLLAEPGKAVMAYDEMLWGTMLQYHFQNPVTALELFRWLRQSTYELVKDLPEEKWRSTGLHPEHGEYSLETWLEIYTRHVPDHIAQMQQVYDTWLEMGE
jgi:uncharacterized damage-inducible protein DinB